MTKLTNKPKIVKKIVDTEIIYSTKGSVRVIINKEWINVYLPNSFKIIMVAYYRILQQINEQDF